MKVPSEPLQITEVKMGVCHFRGFARLFPSCCAGAYPGRPTVRQGTVGVEATGMADTQSWASQPEDLNGETGHCSKEEAGRQ